MRHAVVRVISLLFVAAWLCAGAAFAVSVSPEPTPLPTPTPTPLPVYEDTLEFSLESPPLGMVAPEPILVEFTLANDGIPIGDIRICRDNGSVIEEVGTLPFDDVNSYQFRETITPTDTQLNEGQMVYLIRYTLGIGRPGAKPEQRPLVVPLTKLPAEPGVEFTRNIPVMSAKQGEQVSIAYRVRNTGNVALTDIVVTDGALGEVGRLEQLEPGARKPFIYPFELTETFTSKPVLTYSHRATRDTFEEELTGVVIYLADEQLDITLSADHSTVSPGDTVTLTYRVVNRGSVSYDHLRLSDQVLGDLGTPLTELKPDMEYVFTKLVSMKTTTTFLFTLTGLSEGGSAIEASSNPLTVAVTPVVDDVVLELTAVASAEVLDGPGDVDFTLTVDNQGELDIRDVRLMEMERGEIKTLAVAAPGQTHVTQRYHVDEPGEFVFVAELIDAKGGRMRKLSKPPIRISFGPGGSPGATHADDRPLAAMTGAPYQLPENPRAFFQMLVGILVALALLTTFMAAAAISRRRKKKRQRDKRLRMLRRNYRREQLEDERQQTRPHAPVRERPKPPDSRRPGSVIRKEGK